MLHLFVWLIVLLRQQETLTAKTWGIAILAGLALGIATLARSIYTTASIIGRVMVLIQVKYLASISALTACCCHEYPLFDALDYPQLPDF